jgi:hypothetical protein
VVRSRPIARAVELLSAGIDARTVANRLGHERTPTTLDIYWAWVPARDRDAATHLGILLRGESPVELGRLKPVLAFTAPTPADQGPS